MTNTLNVKHGQGWQVLGWKLDQENDKSEVLTVRFLWSEKGVNKEAVWQVDSKTHQIKALNQEAALVTP